MKCLALLSGGKDSVAAVDVAQGHGWDVIAGLAMLPEEDDAWMFHTPNMQVVTGVAECLGIPLMTWVARPDSIDEVEDLKAAIAEAKSKYGIEAVISGALASEYQRTRIDRICHELSLHSFAPLWHKEPHAYLASLQGYDIRFSRVAADGLDAEMAGAKLHDELPRIVRLAMHPAGEGGEYETLVLDAPHYLAKIVVDDAEVEASASRATWHVRKWHVEPRPA